MTDANTMTKTECPSGASRSRETRQTQLRRMLTRKSGATIDQMQMAFGWQPHTARAALSSLRKSGEVIERSTTEKGAVYRILKPEAS